MTVPRSRPRSGHVLSQQILRNGMMAAEPGDMQPRLPQISRRSVLKVGLLAASALLAACNPVQEGGRLYNDIDWSAWWRRQRRTGTVAFANWPYYIDRTRDNRHPSLELFTRE